MFCCGFKWCSMRLSSFVAPVGGSEAKVDKRTHFWRYFATVHSNINYSWIILSDYNKILHPDDKSGGVAPNLNLITMCRTLLQNLQLKELEFKGHAFTWKRKNLMENLDQTYGNNKWFKVFSNAYLLHLPFIPTSDHCLILLCIGDQINRDKTKIGWRFERWCTNLLGYQKVLTKLWTESQ